MEQDVGKLKYPHGTPIIVLRFDSDNAVHFSHNSRCGLIDFAAIWSVFDHATTDI